MGIDFRYIPGQRYVFLLQIDGRRLIALGRFRRRETIDRLAGDLKKHKGYKPEIIDTRLLSSESEKQEAK